MHEYVHAAVDEFCGGGHRLPTWLNEGLAEYVEWRYLGGDGDPPVLVNNALRGAAKAGKLPKLSRPPRAPSFRPPTPAWPTPPRRWPCAS